MEEMLFIPKLSSSGISVTCIVVQSTQFIPDLEPTQSRFSHLSASNTFNASPASGELTLSNRLNSFPSKRLNPASVAIHKKPLPSCSISVTSGLGKPSSVPKWRNTSGCAIPPTPIASQRHTDTIYILRCLPIVPVSFLCSGKYTKKAESVCKYREKTQQRSYISSLRKSLPTVLCREDWSFALTGLQSSAVGIAVLT